MFTGCFVSRFRDLASWPLAFGCDAQLGLVGLLRLQKGPQRGSAHLVLQLLYLYLSNGVLDLQLCTQRDRMNPVRGRLCVETPPCSRAQGHVINHVLMGGGGVLPQTRTGRPAGFSNISDLNNGLQLKRWKCGGSDANFIDSGF